LPPLMSTAGIISMVTYPFRREFSGIIRYLSYHYYYGITIFPHLLFLDIAEADC
jgi:hypothetical protein